MNNPMQYSGFFAADQRLKLVFKLIVSGFFLITVIACQPEPVQVNKNPLCGQPQNTNEHCRFSLGETQVWLTSTDTQMPVERSITLTVQSQQPVSIQQSEIRGLSMYMGRLPVVWEEHEEQWQAHIMLGACTSRHMIWELRIMDDMGNQLNIPFSSYIPDSPN